MSSTVNLDRAAVAMSLSCIIHCVALPIFAVSMPILSGLAEREWVHWVFAASAVLASAAVFARAHSARSPWFAAPVLAGLTFLIVALFPESTGANEDVLTVIGGLLLAGAHGLRLVRHSRRTSGGSYPSRS
ncbi:MerC domain-containing protein [Aurantiacibacter sp. D1-12]|uniref:MerC domain-containing protein n=1 Tax=Aurantiacibacter sp. D1-12 TaxID=2993658 RepID=UPI00237D1985|nr:MerC domain-containing protein [Aurantiacibacter sp. D1-12]MDE1467169.1 MerC domain-containing protein [Aurantiacibacter sp. D1-12]